MRNALALVLPPVLIVALLFVFQNNLFLEHNQLQYMWYAAGVVGFLALASIAFYHMMGESAKKTMFYLIAIVIIGFTAFLNASILYKNYVSPYHGVVHWHAEVTFDICGTDYKVASRNIATDKPLHTHADSWVHIETTPISLEEVELHWFFKYIGGDFTDSMLSFPSDEGQVTVKNGDLCNGRPGTLSMLVNGKPEPRMGSYVISPVEAGDIDKIRIVFGE